MSAQPLYYACGIYPLPEPVPSHKRLECVLCGDSFAGEPLIHFAAVLSNEAGPACSRCASGDRDEGEPGDEIPSKWRKRRAEARTAGFAFVIVQESRTAHAYREFYFRTETGALAYLNGELRKKGRVSPLP